MREKETKFDTAWEYLKQRLPGFSPVWGIVLGSGLGALTRQIQQAVRIPYETIPGFPVSTVKGHEGVFVAGTLNGVQVLAMSGRFHYYEGYTPAQMLSHIPLFASFGIKKILLTNAAGGINPSYQAGDLMVLKDHLDLGCLSFNKIENLKRQALFSPCQIYDKTLQQIALAQARELNIDLKVGTYAFMSGPSYETPAEIKALYKLGADAVGMSTVPEASLAYQEGIQVLGLSCITNMAAGIGHAALSHQEVMETSAKTADRFQAFIQSIISFTGGAQ